MCRGRGAVVFCPGGRLVFQRSWGGSESEEPAERNLASVSCHRWLLSESARIMQSNLAGTYEALGRPEVLQMKRDVYTGYLKHYGEEHGETITVANNYANCLLTAKRFDETKSLLRKVIPMARRVLTDSHEITLKMRWTLAMALHDDPSSTLDDVREAVETLESVIRFWKRVFGNLHPETQKVQNALDIARMKLARARAAASNKSKPPP